MKTKLMILTLSALPFAVSGCVTDTQSLAKAVEKELDISVTLAAKSDDQCANQQAMDLYRQYSALKKGPRAKVRAQLKAKFKSITLNPTAQTQRFSGTATSLEYGHTVCNGLQCWFVRDASKIIQNGVTKEGTPPQNQVDKSGEALVLTPQSSINEVIGTHYRTTNMDVYDRIESTADPLFLQARQAGSVVLVGEDASVGTTCAATVTLEKILN